MSAYAFWNWGKHGYEADGSEVKVEIYVQHGAAA
jgi:hypothetical protein